MLCYNLNDTVEVNNEYIYVVVLQNVMEPLILAIITLVIFSSGIYIVLGCGKINILILFVDIFDS